MSLLSWERGLKSFTSVTSPAAIAVAPLVGAWIEIVVKHYFGIVPRVAPLVGAWIEIPCCCSCAASLTSLLSWERGLKLILRRPAVFLYVAPLVGAWIEMSLLRGIKNCVNVAPLVGAWIEIFVAASVYCCLLVAPLVGAWIEISIYTMSASMYLPVAPLVGAWIEIFVMW